MKKKAIEIILELGKILKKKNRTIINEYMIEEVKGRDADLEEILKLEESFEDYILNFSRLKRIIKDVLPDSMVGYEANLDLLKYLQLWLEVQIQKAMDNMRKEDKWRKTIKERDFLVE